MRSADLYSEVNSKTKTAKSKSFQHHHVPEANELINEGSSCSSTSHHEAGMSSFQGMSAKVGFIKQLKERLSTLEEEAESLRQDFLQSAEERRKLMNEIYEQFQVICSRDQVASDKNCMEAQKRQGLTQVLCQDNLNLSSQVIIRDLKAKAAILESTS